MKNQKLKFNVFDAAILIFIISVIIYAYFSVNSRVLSLLPYQPQKATVTIITDENVYDRLAKNDSLSFYNTNKNFGTVISVNKRIKNEFQKNNETISFDGLYDNGGFEYVIKVATEIKITEEGKFINSDTFCATGSKYNLKSGNLFFVCRVKNIEIN